MEESVDLKKICKKIIGIGRNYKEPNKDYQVISGHPMIFAKPTTSLITEGQAIQVELGVVIGKSGKFICKEDAMDYVLGYVLALDMTAKLDMQEYSMLLIKGFDTSCPIGPFIPKTQVEDVNNLDLKLSVNGKIRQLGNTKDLIHKIPALINYLSGYFQLEYGDLILTGTPSGISTVESGDVIEASLGDNLSNVKFNVVELN